MSPPKIKILYIFRPVRPGVSIEVLFNNIIRELPSNIIADRYVLRPGILQILDFFILPFKKHDIFHITGEVHYVSIFLYFKKVILTIHDINYYNNNLIGIKKSIFWFFWIYLPYKVTDEITVISEYTKKQILDEKYICDTSKINVINNFTNFAKKNAKFNNFGRIFYGKKIILHIGTDPNKNLERVLLSIANINVKLLIVGFVDKDHIKKCYPQLDISFINNIDIDILKFIYHISDLVLFPSLSEGFGMPIIEAQSCGVPVVTSNKLPMSDIAGKGALLVDPTSIDEIKNGINNILFNEEVCDSFIKLGFENIKRFNKESIIDSYVKLYSKLLNY